MIVHDLTQDQDQDDISVRGTWKRPFVLNLCLYNVTSDLFDLVGLLKPNACLSL
jgi:hypothetical protein